MWKVLARLRRIAYSLWLVKKSRATFLHQLGVEHRPRVSRSSLVPCFQQLAGFVLSFRSGRNWYALSFTKLCWNLVWNETRKSNDFADEQSQFHSVTLIKSRLQFLHCQLSAIHSINSFHLNTTCKSFVKEKQTYSRIDKPSFWLSKLM